MKTYLMGGLIAIAIAAGLGWYRTEVARARAQGRIEVLSVQVNELATSYQAFKDSVAERDSLRNAEQARLAERADSLDAALVVQRRLAQHSRKELNDLLAQSGVPDSVSRAVDATIEKHEREVETCSLAYQNCRQRLNIETERAMDYRAQLMKADSLNAAQKNVIAQLKDLGQPSNTLPWIIAGVAVALAGAVIVF